MRTAPAFLFLLSCSCSGSAPAAPPEAARSPWEGGHFALRGGTVVGRGRADVELRDGWIVAVGEVDPDVPGVDVASRWIAPAFVDGHVHLAYLPVAEELAAGGVAAAVDLASPVEFLAEDHAPLRLLASGPMVTAVEGYPLSSWGRDGYGVPCESERDAVLAVEDLHGRGAGVIKIPLAGGPELDDAVLRAAIEQAHALGMKVAVHALGDDEARRTAVAGADVLAHTPTEPLSDATLDAWAGRAVISTLGAFGGSPAAVENLRALRARGVTVLYGTDLGNTSDAGISLAEIELLVAAGLGGESILAAGTSAPAAYFGFDDLGAVEPGRAASLVVLARDPLQDPAMLAAPVAVYIDGAPAG